MSDNKKTLGTVGAIVLGLTVGAGADRLAAPSFEVKATPTMLAISKDGYGLSVDVSIGAGRVRRVLNWDRNGGTPLLDGQPFDSDNAREIGKAAAAFVHVAEAQSAQLSGALAQPVKTPARR